QAEDGIRDPLVTGVQTCALPISLLELQGVALRPALDAVDLAVEAGQVLALLGGPGTGKTTLLKVACALLRPEAGHVWLRDGGSQIGRASCRERGWGVEAGVGVEE